jgi:hypothetical protein
MSWGTCYNASNNIHNDFPALMSSGNLYTNYNSACKTNNQIKEKTGMKSNYQYRQWLINNAESVMKSNSIAACGECCGCMENFTPRPDSQKYLYKGCGDNTKPFGYESSDLKNLYLSREQLQGRLAAPIITQNDFIKMGLPNYN